MTMEMNIYFVLPSHYEDELSTSEEMQQAFELCRQNQIIPEWISETNCLEKEFDRKDIVVFEKFEGETFNNVKTRLSVVGPWCIITCLIEGLQVPSNKSPIYNMAMCKLVVTASNYTAEEKKKMKEKVEMMGGTFILHITNSTTHLVTNCVRTQKYAVANQKDIPVMLDTWIEDVWNCSLSRNVKATDIEFQKHKCPCFKNLRVCSTGFEIEDRNKVEKLIVNNGGKYSGKLLTATVDFLICKPGIKSEKYEVARKAKIPCVRMEWIHASIEKGYAQPDCDYTIKVASSTPTKGDAPLNPDFSMMSIIAGNDHTESHIRTSVSDTMNVSLYNLTTQNRKEKEVTQKENQEPDIVSELDMQAVKRAGTFLDGCGVLLVGFSSQQRDKLNRVLRSAGATRYDAPTDRVTQVIVENPNCHEVRLVEGRAPLVSPAWLLESMRRGQPVSEEPYIVHTYAEVIPVPAPSSPLSKKGLTLLQNDSMAEMEPPKPPEPEPEHEHESIKLYKTNKANEEDTLAQLIAHGNLNTRCETTTAQGNDQSEQDETLYNIFQDKVFKLLEHSEEEIEFISSKIEELGGKIVGKNFRGVTDYVVLPAISGPVQHVAEEVVNSIWILECHSLVKLLPLKYYHQPLIITNNAQPLEDCVISISGYLSFERTFLVKLIQSLGAIYQEKFARITQENSDILGCTHLVCFEPSGSKWNAAQRWKKYAVTHKWLLKCAETGQKVPEEQYLRTDSDPEENVPETPKIKQQTNIRKSPTPSTSRKSENVSSVIAPKTPAMNNKRDHEGKRITPPENLNLNTSGSIKRDYEGKRISPESSQSDQINKMRSELDKTQKKSDEELLITLDDGRKIAFAKFMDELREQGTFDTPSPVPKQTGTPIQEFLARLRREGKIPSDTPTKNTAELGAASQGTPVGRYLRGLQERNVLPSSPKQSDTESPIPRNMFDVKTPETPLGRFAGEDNPSKTTRKQWQRYLDRFPHYPVHDSPKVPQRRPSTPWSEVKRQAWTSLMRNNSNEESSQPPEPETVSQQLVSKQIGQLQELMKKRESIGPDRSTFLGAAKLYSSSSDLAQSNAKDSQTEDQVGWDEELENCVFSETMGPRKFMISGIDKSERSNICNIICSLGGEVSELNNFDSTATHILCPNPSRNEKILSSMAAGLWVLHVSYVEKSGAAGRFLPEEEYELGNPKSEGNIQIDVTPLIEAIHWWRVKIRDTKKGAFHEMRALIFAKNTKSVVRVIEAGGGTVLEASPPFMDRLDVTHCFIEPKLKLDLNEFIPLAEQGVPCLNVLYMSSFLCNRTNANVNEYILPELSRYYN